MTDSFPGAPRPASNLVQLPEFHSRDTADMTDLILTHAPDLSLDDARVPTDLRQMVLTATAKHWWWDETVSAQRGCTPVSAGCKNCWALKDIETRLSKQISGAYTDNAGPTFAPSALNMFGRDLSPKRYFTPSMGDPYHEDFTDEQVFAYHDAMDAAPWHYYFSLTSRPDRLAEIGPYLNWGEHKLAAVSIEDAATISRIEKLLVCGATRTGISAEPIIEALPPPGQPSPFASSYARDLIRELDIVIGGGETAVPEKCRPMHLVHARALRDVCLEEGVPFFFKQWGDIDKHGAYVGRSKADRVLDGQTYNDLPRGCLEHLVRAQGIAAAEKARRRVTRPRRAGTPA